MSVLQVDSKYPHIYPDSIVTQHEEVEKNDKKVTKEKAFFKIFLMNNQLTNPTPELWKVENVDTIERNIDSFIGMPILPMQEEGIHDDPRRFGIIRSRYENKYDYIADIRKFYQDRGVGKIVAIYKPDKNIITAASVDPSIVTNYEALGYTENPAFIQHLNENKNSFMKMWVSPGLYSTDSRDEPDGTVTIKEFVGTHVHIVKDPGFRDPAFIKKEVCNIDGHTCYFRLFTASEIVNLNNNPENNKHMVEASTGGTNNNGSFTPNPDQLKTDPNAKTIEENKANGLKVETTVTNPTDNTQIKTDNNNNKTESKSKNNNKKVELETEPNPESKQEEKSEDNKPSEKLDKEKNAVISFTKEEFKAYMNDFKNEVLNAVDEKAKQRIESENKVNIVNRFIPTTEEYKEVYSFYNGLPLSSGQLERILLDSKFNKDNKKGREYIASSSKNFNTSNYDNESKFNASYGQDTVLIPASADKIPARFR